jgi:hypothetical protein
MRMRASRKTNMNNSTVEEIKALFGQVQELAANKGSIIEARKLTGKIERMVKQLQTSTADIDLLADALSWHCYAVLALSRLCRGKRTKEKLLAQGYEIEAHAVDLRLKGKHDRGVSFAAYNLGIDLIMVQKQATPALHYLVASRACLKHVPKAEVPRDFRLTLNWGIATCEKELGNPEKAARILRATLGGKRPNLSQWGDLRAFAHCEELLAQIILDRRIAESAAAK